VPGARAPGLTFDDSGARFSLDTAAHVELDIYNVAGQRVAHVADGWFGAGEHTVPWRGANGAGEALGTGVYFAKLRAGDVNQTHKLIVSR